MQTSNEVFALEAKMFKADNRTITKGYLLIERPTPNDEMVNMTMTLDVKDSDCDRFYGIIHQSGDLRDARENMNSLGQGIKLSDYQYQIFHIERVQGFANVTDHRVKFY